MSTKREEYVILGANLDYELSNEENLGESRKFFDNEKSGEFIYLSDGMNGEYFVVGQLLAKGDEFEGFYRKLEVDINSVETKNSILAVKKMIKENFDLEVEPKIIVVTHWS